MTREMINDKATEKVMGGSIVFTPDNTMCGLNCNNQCIVNDFDAAINYITEHYQTMDERDMMRNMVQLGYITRV